MVKSHYPNLYSQPLFIHTTIFTSMIIIFTTYDHSDNAKTITNKAMSQFTLSKQVIQWMGTTHTLN